MIANVKSLQVNVNLGSHDRTAQNADKKLASDLMDNSPGNQQPELLCR